MALRDLIKSVSTNWKKKTQDDKGFIQQGKFTLKPIKTAAKTIAQRGQYSAPKNTQKVRDFLSDRINYAKTTGLQQTFGKGNLGDTLYKISPLSMKEAAVPSANAVFGKNTAAADIVGYGLRGATSLTPMGGLGTTQLVNKISPGTAKTYEPQTQRQQTAQRAGKAIYGTLLTAPLGGSNYLANIGSRALQGMALGTGLKAGSNLLSGKKLTSNLGEGALSGLENSWQLAFTNAIADKLAGGTKILKGLTPESMKAGSTALKTAVKAGSKDATKIFANNAMKIFERALLETPIENTWFTALGKLSGDDKRKFVNAWLEDLPGNFLGNMAYATLNVGKQGLVDLNKNQLDTATKSIKNVLNSMFGGSLDSQSGKIDFGAEVGGKKSTPEVKIRPKELGEGYYIDARGTAIDVTEHKANIFNQNDLRVSLTPSQLNIDTKTNLTDGQIKTLKNMFNRIKMSNPDAKIYADINGKGGVFKNIDEFNSQVKSTNTLFKINNGTSPDQTQIKPEQSKLGSQATQESLFPQKPLVSTEGTSQPPLISGTKIESQPSISQKGKLNTKYLNLTDEQKVALDELQKAEPTVISNKQVLKKSKTTKGRTSVRTDEQQTVDLAKALNTRQEVVGLQKEFDNLKQQGASVEDLIKVKEKIIEQSKIAQQESTFAGRRLQAEKILADVTATPEQRIYAALDAEGVDQSKYLKDAVNIDFNDSKQVVEFYRKYVPAKFSEMLTEFRYTNMLSSPLTHVINTSTNALQSALIKPIEKTISGQLDWIKSTITGSERKYYASQGIDYAKGYWKSLPEAWTKFKNMVTGEEIGVKPDLMSTNAEYIPTTTQGPLKWYTTPLRVLEGADQFFKTLIKGGETKALSDSRLKLSTEEIAKKAEQSGDYTLFRQRFDPDGKLGQGYVLKVWDKWNSTINNLRKNPAGKWLIPFLQTPTNILKQGVEYSPLGFTTMIGAKNATEQMSKALIGTAVFTGLYNLADSGQMTWSAPGNKKDKELFYSAGMQPYSIKIGDKWVSYSKLGPLAYPMAMAGALKWAEKNNPDQNVIQDIGKAIPQMMIFFGDQSYVQELGNILDALRSGEGAMFSNALTSEISNLGGQLVPLRSFMGWLTRAIDPTYRKAGTFKEKIFAQIPGASESVPTYTDMYGQPSQRDMPLYNAISPYKVSIEKPAANRLYESQEQYRIDQNQLKKMQEEFEKTGKISTGSNTIKIKQNETSKGESGKNIPRFYTKDTGEVAKLDLDSVINLPESSQYEKAIKVDKVYGLVKTIMKNVSDEEQKNTLLNELGVSYKDASYYQIASQNEDIRLAAVMDRLQTATSTNEVGNILYDGLYAVNGKAIVTPAILNDLVNQGVITKDFKNAILKAYNNAAGLTSGSSGGSGKYDAPGSGYYASKVSTTLKKAPSMSSGSGGSIKFTMPKFKKINLKYGQ